MSISRPDPKLHPHSWMFDFLLPDGVRFRGSMTIVGHTIWVDWDDGDMFDAYWIEDDSATRSCLTDFAKNSFDWADYGREHHTECLFSTPPDQTNVTQPSGIDAVREILRRYTEAEVSQIIRDICAPCSTTKKDNP